ncbi:hypothetical protein [Candidatus Merdisoma sp. JLR.KK006]|uniref:hypothetical protein n=1 Tax=Candidatus Merdisoma sp. JLR.KK006 TaxID=3112626 RepID=UPI002FF183C6
MAANKGNVPNEMKAAQEERTAPKKTESVYTASELADNASVLFKARRECVLAALREAGVQSCTLSRAKELVEKFRKKEVK